MRRVFVVAVLFGALASLAGEKQLGVITSSDGGTVNNAGTGYGSAGCNTTGDGACAQAFKLSAPQLISIQCDAAAKVAVNRATNDAGIGVKLAADQLLTTSLDSNVTVAVTPDGGTYTGGVVSIVPIGSSTANCVVNSRRGNE